MYVPFNYDELNLLNAYTTPATVKQRNNRAFNFWSRSLFQRACSAIDFDLPKAWEGPVRDFFYYCLFRFGYVAVYDDSERGIVFQPCTLNGHDFYYQPVKALVTNPVYKNTKELVLGRDAELIKLTPDYMGICDVIDYYAGKLAEMDVAINTSLINSKFGFILGVRNKAASAAIKMALDRINRGEPAVILDKNLANDMNDKAEPWQLIDFKIKENHITGELLTEFQTIINAFDAEIGIPTIPYQKKERLVESEADSKAEDASARCKVWLASINGSIENVKALFPGLTLSARYAYEQKESEGVNNG